MLVICKWFLINHKDQPIWRYLKHVSKQGGETDMREKVKEALEKVRPFLQRDGGDVELVDVNEATGVVSVKLKGACGG